MVNVQPTPNPVHARLPSGAPRRVLLATEVGAGMGHFAPWASTVRELLARGHHVAVAAFDLAGAMRHLVEPLDQAARQRLTLLPSPPVPRLRLPAHAPECWPDIMLGLGYDDAHAWGGALLAWRQFMAGYQVDWLLADHAPSALLAAAELGVEAVEVGSGFCVPPIAAAGHAMAALPTANPSATHLANSDAAFTQAANQALALAGFSRRLQQASDVFRPSAARWVTSPPELDHYGRRTGVDYVGFALDSLPISAAAPSGFGLVGYLKPNTPGLANVLQQLKRECAHAGWRARVLVPGGPAELTRHSAQGVEVRTAPEPLEPLLAGAHGFVTNGGLHGVGQALRAGAKVWCLPMHKEQAATAANLAAAGWGGLWQPNPQSQPEPHSAKEHATGVSYV